MAPARRPTDADRIKAIQIALTGLTPGSEITDIAPELEALHPRNTGQFECVGGEVEQPSRDDARPPRRGQLVADQRLVDLVVVDDVRAVQVVVDPLGEL